MNLEMLITVGLMVFVIVALMAIAAKAITLIRPVFIVPEGFAGLIYQNGKFVTQVKAGRRVRWGRRSHLNLTDLRKISVCVAGQEVLTADSVGLKLSLLITYQVIDPLKAAHETQNWQGDIYNIAQVALRAVVGSVAVETLLGQRLELGAQLLARVQPETAKIGVNVHSVEVKYVIFPAELKRAFAEVLKAKQEGQAALERARGESAALRNLANAARVLDGNPSLMNLRLLQSISAAQTSGNTLVLGMPNGFVPVKNGKATSEIKLGDS